jgi:hypothetical protein
VTPHAFGNPSPSSVRYVSPLSRETLTALKNGA